MTKQVFEAKADEKVEPEQWISEPESVTECSEEAGLLKSARLTRAENLSENGILFLTHFVLNSQAIRV